MSLRKWHKLQVRKHVGSGGTIGSADVVELDDVPDSKVHGASMGPIWDRQDPGGPHIGPMSLSIWDAKLLAGIVWKIWFYISMVVCILAVSNYGIYLGCLLLTTIRQIIRIMASISNHNHANHCNVITCPCFDFNGDLVKSWDIDK